MDGSSLEGGAKFSDFVLLETHHIDEADAICYIFEHTPSHSKLMWMSCDDTNRAFAITFKTPPKDDTGVFHIIEHSVLDGSEKYPLHEPFVNLLKTSMHTFLNAFTFSDKTMYPVASTNVQDLENLIDVYLDAVFHPLLLKDDNIFAQEGWHLEETEDGELVVNGVVYNEMKGALSDPEDVLAMELKRALFPNTAYGFESGGNPVAIPNLTTEAFRDAHLRHYNLENAHSFLYGKLDIARELAFLSERFKAVSPAHGAPNELSQQPAVVAPAKRVYLSTSSENAMVGVAYVIGSYKDRKRILAMQVLLDALMGSNEAPLKKALLEAHLGDDVQAYLFDGILQPFVVFMVRGATAAAMTTFQDILLRSCKELVKNGISCTRLEAALAQLTFSLRERDFGYPDGIAYAIQAMSGWLYDEAGAYDYLHYEDTLHELSEALACGFFEKLLDEVVCNSAHSAEVALVTQKCDACAPATADAACARIAEAHVDEVRATERALKEKQETPDSPEALALIPRLHIEDIDTARKLPNVHKFSEGAFACTHYEMQTHGITYANLYFDAECLDWREVPYLGMLATLLGRLDTRVHSADELDTLVNLHLGELSFSLVNCFQAESPLDKYACKFVVEAAAIDEETHALASLPHEIYTETIFDDSDRIYTILQQQRIHLEQCFITDGHKIALEQVRAAYVASERLNDATSGISYYHFLCDALDAWETKRAAISEVLRNISARIFKQNGALATFSGSESSVRTYWKYAHELDIPCSRLEPKRQLVVPCGTQAATGYTTPGEVCYVALGAETLTHHTPYSAAWLVAAKALTYGYLWNKVRVLGGAYGSGFVSSATSAFGFYSYRDPNVLETIQTYLKAGAWLSHYEPESSELEGYIVSCVASLDAPQKPHATMKKLDMLALSGRPLTYLQELRQAVLTTSSDAVRRVGKGISSALDAKQYSVCVLGPKELLEKTKSDLTVEKLV